MAFDAKMFLDYEGLSSYDALIKKYIKDNAGDLADSLAGDLDLVKQEVSANNNAIEILKAGVDTEGSVAKTVKDAIDKVVADAPEALDTLKEIADWIAADETGTSTLLTRVTTAETAIKDLKAEDIAQKTYIDTQDAAVYNSIGSIEKAKIAILFKEAKEVAADASVAEALADLNADEEYLVLAEGATVAENLTIGKDVYIDANGATFTGTVEVDGTKDIVIENAVFSKPVAIK